MNNAKMIKITTATHGKRAGGQIMRYDMGKYNSGQCFLGMELTVAKDVLAVWSERQKDSDGPYKALFCAIGD